MNKVLNNKVSIMYGDIKELAIDAIINAEDNTLLNGEIYVNAGHTLYEQCKRHGGCPTGEARITTAGNLPCKYVIHTVTPLYGIYNDNNDIKLLENSYINSLELAIEYNIKSIAFPPLTKNDDKHPNDEEIRIAFDTISNIINNDSTIERVVFVLSTEDDYDKYLTYNNKLINERGQK